MTGTAQVLWDRLHAAGLVTQEAPPGAAEDTPWYVGAMLGIAGWIAALFLLGFIGSAFAFVFKTEAAAMVVGVFAVAGAYAIFRIGGRGAFLSQFGFAAALAGQVLILFGLAGMIKPEQAAFWLIVAGLEAALAVALPNFIHRVWSAYAAATALAIALALSHAYFLSTGLLSAVVLTAWIGELNWASVGSVVRPIAYGLTLSLLQVVGFVAFDAADIGHLLGRAGSHQWMQPWMGEGLAAAILVIAAYQLLRHAGIAPLRRDALAALLACILVGLASLKAPGIATGLMVLLLGFAGGNRVLSGLGIAALVLYLCTYYYTLESTLLMKSAVLAATGAVLLATRWLGLKWFVHEAEGEHA